jgi:hypothetical protein
MLWKRLVGALGALGLDAFVTRGVSVASDFAGTALKAGKGGPTPLLSSDGYWFSR